MYRLHQEDRSAVDAVGRILPSIAAAAQAAHDALAEGGRLIYVGAGTSGRLGVLDASECPPTFGSHPGQVVAVLAGGPDAVLRAIEGAEDDADGGAQAMRRLRLRRRDLVVGIAASGSTPFVVGALRAARAAKARTVLVSCNPARAAKVRVDLHVTPDTGPELVAGSTRLKAGTATKLVLNAISTAAFVALGKVYRGRMIDLRPTNEKLRLRAQRMVQELTGLSPSAAKRLLAKADGNPKLALAIHFTGLEPDAAARALKQRGLRGLRQRG